MSTKAQSIPAGMTADEHRALAEKLRRVTAEVRAVNTLIRDRYPSTARCRFLSTQADADIRSLRLSLSGVVNVEMPFMGINYTDD